jgi:hypothetical protein
LHLVTSKNKTGGAATWSWTSAGLNSFFLRLAFEGGRREIS